MRTLPILGILLTACSTPTAYGTYTGSREHVGNATDNIQGAGGRTPNGSIDSFSVGVEDGLRSHDWLRGRFGIELERRDYSHELNVITLGAVLGARATPTVWENADYKLKPYAGVDVGLGLSRMRTGGIDIDGRSYWVAPGLGVVLERGRFGLDLGVNHRWTEYSLSDNGADLDVTARGFVFYFGGRYTL